MAALQTATSTEIMRMGSNVDVKWESDWNRTEWGGWKRDGSFESPLLVSTQSASKVSIPWILCDL
jgi:hypothetical protein